MPYMPRGPVKITSATFKQTLANAERLLSDSKLLLLNGRYESAVILSVFAIEELGKSLIIQWDVKNIASKREYPTHIEKQSATFALLSAKEIINFGNDKIIKHIQRGTFNCRKIGPFSNQFAWARAGFYDNLRMSATYSDKNPKIPSKFMKELDAEFVGELHDYFEKALMTFDDTDAMQLASIIYSNDLGRL